MVGLKTDLNIWNVRLLVIHYVTYFALLVKYVSVMIQRRSGTNFNGIFVNLKLTTEGQKAINITCTGTQTVKFKEIEIKLSIISKQGWTWSTPVQPSKGMKSA